MNRKRKLSLPGPLVLVGGVALGYAGLKVLLGLRAKADEGFFDWDGPAEKGVDVGSASIDVPAMYYRDDWPGRDRNLGSRWPPSPARPWSWPGASACRLRFSRDCGNCC